MAATSSLASSLGKLNHHEVSAAMLRLVNSNQRFLRNAALCLALAAALPRANAVLNHLAYNNYTAARPWDWSREIVLVTGAASGIGLVVAGDLASRGITIVGFDVSERPSTDVLPSAVRFYRVDVTDPGEVHSAAERMRAEVGEPTVLVNNAGVSRPGLVVNLQEADVRKTFEVNTMAHFIMVKEFMPSMIAQDHGHVVTVASLASFLASPGNMTYGCTKASAMAFHEGLGQELKYSYGAKHVRTSIIHFYFTRTPMVAHIADQFGDKMLDPEDVASKIVAQILEGKSGRVVVPDRMRVASYLRALPDWLNVWWIGPKANVKRPQK